MPSLKVLASYLPQAHDPLVFSVIIASAILIVFLLLRKIFIHYIFKILSRLTEKTATDVDEKILASFQNPAQMFFIIVGIYLAVLSLPQVTLSSVLLSKLFRTSVICLLTWGIYNLEDPASGIFKGLNQKLTMQFDAILIPFFSRVLRIITILLAFIIIAQEWNYRVDSFIAGLGLGGLAFALAAQDSLANIFGGVIIVMDRPFSIGDWIATSSVEGTVEDINFRSTKVRTFAQAIVTVPNKTIANEAITNWSRRGKRRINFNLGVTYTTSKTQLEKCVSEIKNMLLEHPQVHNDTLFVTFDQFNDSSLDIMIYCFAKTTDWETFLNIKQDINFRIMDILEGQKVSVAFPSRSLYLETPTIYLDTSENGSTQSPAEEFSPETSSQ